jgi:hypothetical protein
MGKRFGLLNVNGVKVAFTEAQKAQVENKKGPGLLSLDLEKWK